MLHPNHEENIKTIAVACGSVAKTSKAIEELAELIRALVRDDEENLTEEIADVEIMIEQIMFIYGIDRQHVDVYKNSKVRRTLERLGLPFEEVDNEPNC